MTNIHIDFGGDLYGEANDQYWLALGYNGTVGIIGNHFEGGRSLNGNPAENPNGKDHLLVYEITALPDLQPSLGAGKIGNVLFWEDGSDDDFNDFVIGTDFHNVLPTNVAAVPIPPTFMAGLLTMGVAGIGYAKRRWYS
jgi:hypothetical protein